MTQQERDRTEQDRLQQPVTWGALIAIAKKADEGHKLSDAVKFILSNPPRVEPQA